MPNVPDGPDTAGGSGFFRFPQGGVECMSGDYVICGQSGSRWEVYRVEDILLVRRLVARLTTPATLVVEDDLLDSMTPAYFGEVQFLLTVFDPDFAEESAAIEAIQKKALRQRVHGLFRAAREFSKTDCRVFRPPVAR